MLGNERGVKLPYFFLSFLFLSSLFTDLEDGQLIHGDNFNLFAAMSALEV